MAALLLVTLACALALLAGQLRRTVALGDGAVAILAVLAGLLVTAALPRDAARAAWQLAAFGGLALAYSQRRRAGLWPMLACVLGVVGAAASLALT